MILLVCTPILPNPRRILRNCRLRILPDDFEEAVAEVEPGQQPEGDCDGKARPISQTGQAELAGGEIKYGGRGYQGQPYGTRPRRTIPERGPKEAEAAPEIQPSTPGAHRRGTKAKVEAAFPDLVTAGFVDQSQPRCDGIFPGR